MKVMFSKVDGVVLNHGQPVPNAVVTRYFNFGWTDTQRTDSTKTAADGTFHFPVARRFSLFTSIIPHEPCVSQTIKVYFDEKEFIVWWFIKHNY